ncbi:hypothetical protein GCM10010343_31170 [Streptomyces avidinii]|nr:hypothetical protein GCM10010343_31170 [Streptomyces avidinii]
MAGAETTSLDLKADSPALGDEVADQVFTTKLRALGRERWGGVLYPRPTVWELGATIRCSLPGDGPCPDPPRRGWCHLWASSARS